MPPHPLTNFEIQQYYQNKTKLNSTCLGNKLPTIKDEAYVINLDEYELIGTQWIALSVNLWCNLWWNTFENKFKHS